ncbi:MAG TPA: DNA-directed RNA polymerase subunit omega [Thermoanaerobaculia bacterium]|nr:DNA-directed RNA polymerase subunit omega [Thermoanaerobaculia bacterium]
MTDVPPIESKFRLVHIAARRAEQLMMGARPKVETKHAKVTRVALSEVDQNLIRWQLAPAESAPADIPLADPLPTESA